MRRVAVIGCGGSGKTHLARQLAARLDLPLTHLDALYYNADWSPNDEFVGRQKQLVGQPRWIFEGNYVSTLPLRLATADTVIILDLPSWICLWGVLQRRFRHGGGQHPAIGVYDRINASFLRYILGYRRSMLPRVHRLIDETTRPPGADVVVLRSRRAARRFGRGIGVRQ